MVVPPVVRRLASLVLTPRIARLARIVLVLGAFGILALLVGKNWGTIGAVLVRGDYRWLLVALALYFLDMAAAIIGWHGICRWLKISRGASLDGSYYALSMVAGRLPGGIWGLVARVYLYRSDDVKASLAAAAWGAEQVMILLSAAFCLPIWLAVSDLPGGPVLSRAPLLLSLVMLIAIGRFDVGGLVARRVFRYSTSPGSAWERPPTRYTLAWWLATYSALWCIGGMVLFTILRVFVALPVNELPSVEAAWIGSRTISVLVTVLPSSLGITEASLALMLTPIVAGPVAAAVAILARLVTTIGEALTAGAFYVLGCRIARGPAESIGPSRELGSEAPR